MARDLRRAGEATIACLAGVECDAVHGDPVSISQHTADGRGEVWPTKTQLRLVATSRSPIRFQLLQGHNVWPVR